MTLDNLECQNRGFYGFLAISGCETHFKSELCQNQMRYTQGQAAYKILSIERRFWRSKSRFFRFKETCRWGHQRAIPLQKLLFYHGWPVFRENVQTGMDSLPITTSTSDELFSRIKFDDFEEPWTSKIKDFIDFCNFRLQHTSRMNCDKMAKNKLTVCEQQLL